MITFTLFLYFFYFYIFSFPISIASIFFDIFSFWPLLLHVISFHVIFFYFLNADNHSPVSSARSTKRWMGCLCQWVLKAPTDRPRSDCVHEISSGAVCHLFSDFFLNEKNSADNSSCFCV